jgi:two-component system sensor histidine kinase RpfC
MQEAAQIMDSAAQLNVLVAAANPMQLKILKGVLERAGHRVISSTTSEGALDEIEAKTGRFDLAIVDEDLPGLGGLDVIRVLRYLDADAHTPAIIRCNEMAEETKVSCIAAGADACLPNPVDPEALLETVAQLSQSEATPDEKKLGAV